MTRHYERHDADMAERIAFNLEQRARRAAAPARREAEDRKARARADVEGMIQKEALSLGLPPDVARDCARRLAKPEEVRALAEAAQAQRFAASLPDVYRTRNRRNPAP